MFFQGENVTPLYYVCNTIVMKIVKILNII